MKKIPVGATVAHAYRFAFGNFLVLLKLLWLPLLATMALNAIVGPQIAAFSAGLQTRDFSAMAMPGVLVVAVMAVSLVSSFMLVTGAFQLALGRLNPRGRIFYLPVDAPLWRLLGAFLLLLLVLAVLLVVYALAAMLVLFLFRLGLAAAHISAAALTNILAFDGLLAFVAGYCGGIFCFVRFGFLLGATTIAEDRIGLFRSWGLSHRNFWRMFGVTLALVLPFGIVEMLGLFALGAIPHVPAGASAAQISALQTATSEAAMAQMQHYWFIYYPALLIITLAMYGLMAGAGSFAYRALTETEA